VQKPLYLVTFVLDIANPELPYIYIYIRRRGPRRASTIDLRKAIYIYGAEGRAEGKSWERND